MVYGDYSGYSGYSGYPSYGQQSGSVLGNNTSMSMTNSQLASAPNLDASNTSNITKGISETYNKTMDGGGGEKKGFFDHFKDFFKGIFNGIKNLVKSLADPKTWLMIAAMVALCVLVPGAGTALMMLGIGMAGMQIFKGVSSGDASQVGEGTFNLALCFLGGSSAIKAGKGEEAANFSRAGTRVTEAENALAAAQKAKDAKAIESATKSLEAARAQMARADVSALTGAQREAHLTRPNVANLKTADDIAAAKASTQKSYMEARASVDSAKTRLAEAEKSGNTASIEKAKTALSTAETNAKQAATNVHDVYMAARIKDIQNMGMMGRVGGHLKNIGTSTKDNFAMMFGKPMTSADGRTITYWSRTPKEPNPAAANAEAASTTASTGSKMNPLNWFKSKPNDNASAGGAAAKTGDDAAVASKEKPKPAASTEGVASPKPPRPQKPKSKPTSTPWVRTPDQAKLAADRAKRRQENHNAQMDDKAYHLPDGILTGKPPMPERKPVPADTPVTNITTSKADIEAIRKANGQHFDNVQQIRTARPQDPPPTPPSNYFAETPGWMDRIKKNAFPGFVGAQGITPLFGMVTGGQGGSLLG